MSQSHDYSLIMPAYTSGQPSSVSDAVTVADMSSAVIGLSVSVVISVTILIVSLVVIIALCHRQGTYGDNVQCIFVSMIMTHCLCVIYLCH